MFRDLTGQRFGRLIVLGRDGKNEHRAIKWKCQCDCGNQISTLSQSLLSGHTKSCGCLHRDIMTKHGGRDCSIERIDTNKGYSPDNCKWATAKEQANNTRHNTRIEYKGKILSLAQWANEFGMNYSTFMSRYSRGWTMERIENKPVEKYRKVV